MLLNYSLSEKTWKSRRKQFGEICGVEGGVLIEWIPWVREIIFDNGIKSQLSKNEIHTGNGKIILWKGGGLDEPIVNFKNDGHLDLKGNFFVETVMVKLMRVTEFFNMNFLISD